MVSPEKRGLVVLELSRVYKNRNREAAEINADLTHCLDAHAGGPWKWIFRFRFIAVTSP